MVDTRLTYLVLRDLKKAVEDAFAVDWTLPPTKILSDQVEE
jgi:hypothetical protein